MTGNRLYKSEKLCSTREIERVFSHEGRGATAYPLRAVYTVSAGNEPTRFMISVPKKRHHHAVDRVLLRRRIREAYRLNRTLLNPALEAAGRHVDVAFIYLSEKIKPYAVIEAKMCELLKRIATQACHQ